MSNPLSLNPLPKRGEGEGEGEQKRGE